MTVVKKGRVIDFLHADDAMIVDTHDLMATFQISRETIRQRMKKGVLPPPLDRAGKRLRWNVGYLKEWEKLRSKNAINALAQSSKSGKISSCCLSSQRSEFG